MTLDDQGKGFGAGRVGTFNAPTQMFKTVLTFPLSPPPSPAPPSPPSRLFRERCAPRHQPPSTGSQFFPRLPVGYRSKGGGVRRGGEE